MRKIILPAALAILSASAFATPEVVEDELLGAHFGQAGISLALNVKVHIDSFLWIDDAGGGFGIGNGNGNGNNAGGAVSFENIAIGGGALSSVAAGTYAGLNASGANDVINLPARLQYQTGVRFGGPINIDVEDVAAFSVAGGQLIAAFGGNDVAADGAAINAHAAQAAYLSGYSAHVPASGSKAVALGLPRMIMSVNIGAVRALGNSGESYSMGGVRITNLDFSSTKVSIWGHK